MGVNLRSLFPSHAIPVGWYHGKRIAVDAHNVAFRYLTSIRGRDGDTLRNPEGRAIGHVLGFLGLVRHLREQGAEPVFVWDGEVHPRKAATVATRIERREMAMVRAEAAREAGDAAEHARLMRSTVYLDGPMIADASGMLEAVGVAVVRADHDAERYAAGLCAAGHCDAVATEDYDALVAGAPAVVRKVGSASAFLHRLEDVTAHGLSPAQLRHVAILCGTDWHPGIRGFGPKTALQAVQSYPDLQALWAEAAADAPGRMARLVAAGGLAYDEFAALDRFVAEIPRPEAPVAPRPAPDRATRLAEQLHIGRERALACFC
jgi:flap endonuclease-1